MTNLLASWSFTFFAKALASRWRFLEPDAVLGQLW
jgi:hypothetical protein